MSFRESIEDVDSIMFKMYLLISDKESSNAVLGGPGRYHLPILADVLDARYKMLKGQDDNGTVKWASCVRLLFFESGLGYAWIW